MKVSWWVKLCLALGVLLVITLCVWLYFDQTAHGEYNHALARLKASGAPMAAEELLAPARPPGPEDTDTVRAIHFLYALKGEEEQWAALDETGYKQLLELPAAMKQAGDDASHQAARRHLDTHAALLAEAKTVAMLPAIGQDVLAHLVLPLDWTGGGRLDTRTVGAAAALLQAEALLALYDGMPDAAVDSLRIEVLLAGKLDQCLPNLLNAVISQSLKAGNVKCFLEQVAPAGPSPAKAAQYLETLDGVKAPLAFARALKGERLMNLALRRMLEEPGAMPASWQPENERGRMGMQLMGSRALRFWRDHDTAVQLDILSDLIEAARMPAHQALPAFKRIEKEQIDQLGLYEFMAVMTLPTLTRSAGHLASRHALVFLARPGWALYRYREDNRAFPEKLEALLPEYLDAIPLDPCTNQPLPYHAREDGAASLYSAGPNQRDDQGREDDALVVLTP